MCMYCKHGKDGPRKRKFDTAIKYPCSACKLAKIEDAFPRAQLKQEHDRKCLSCCRTIAQLKCNECDEPKPVEHFNANMVTFPVESVVCKACQDEMKEKGFRRDRKNWFTCRACGELLPGSLSPDGKERCLNCASRGTRQKDEQTCRNCKSKFHEKQVKGKQRARYCLRCRRKKAL